MTPSEFIAFAGRLAALGSGGEAAIRTIASRSYYGAFHVALEYLAELGFVIPANANAHGIIRRYLSGSGHTDLARVAEVLSDLHSERIGADYRLADRRFQSFISARDYVENAETVRTLLDRCRHEPARSEVRDAINAYLARLN
jgi:hypothetical protein